MKKLRTTAQEYKIDKAKMQNFDTSVRETFLLAQKFVILPVIDNDILLNEWLSFIELIMDKRQGQKKS